MLGKDDKKANALIEKEKGDIKENKDKNSNACRKITFSNVTNKKSNRNKEDKDNKILEKIESKLSNQTSERNEKINENEEELETLSVSNCSDDQKLKATSSTASDSKAMPSNRESKLSSEFHEMINVNKESPFKNTEF